MSRLFAFAALIVVAAVFTGCKSADCCADGNHAHDHDHDHIGHLRHVVLFKYKAGTSPEKIAEIEKAFAALPAKIPSIIDFEWGTNNSPEGLDKGYTHCFLVTFKDAAGREAYLPHPAHKAFVELLLPHLEEAHVVDYVAKE